MRCEIVMLTVLDSEHHLSYKIKTCTNTEDTPDFTH